MKSKNKQTGLSSVWALASLVACLLAAYGFGLLIGFMPDGKILVPVTLLGVIVAPAALVTQLMFKLNDTKKLKGLAREEKRRLDHIANSKIIKLVALLSAHLILTSGAGVLYYLSTLNIPFNSALWALRLTGFLIIAGIIITVHSALETKNISDFEAKISNRAAERKAKSALLKKLSPEKTKT